MLVGFAQGSKVAVFGAVSFYETGAVLVLEEKLGGMCQFCYEPRPVLAQQGPRTEKGNLIRRRRLL